MCDGIIKSLTWCSEKGFKWLVDKGWVLMERQIFMVFLKQFYATEARSPGIVFIAF